MLPKFNDFFKNAASSNKGSMLVCKQWSSKYVQLKNVHSKSVSAVKYNTQHSNKFMNTKYQFAFQKNMVVGVGRILLTQTYNKYCHEVLRSV